MASFQEIHVVLTDLSARVGLIESGLNQLMAIESSLDFLVQNLDYFKKLLTNLDPRLGMIENAITNGLPAQISHQAQLTKTRLVQEASSMTESNLRVQLDAVRTTMDEFRRDAFSTWATKSDLEAVRLSAASTTSASHQSSAKPKVPTPAVFSGKREDWKIFSSHLSIFFTANASMYPEASDKILFAISRLGEGSAFKYMQQYIIAFEQPVVARPLIICDYEVFIKTMSENFGVLNAQVVSETQLRTLKQTGSAMDYTNKFMELAADLDWNDAAKLSQYRRGLKEAVVNILVLDEPKTFAEFTSRAIFVDSMQYSRYLEAKQTQPAPRTSSTTNYSTNRTQFSVPRPAPVSSHPPTPSVSSTPSMAMELGQARHLTPEEKQQRKDTNACFYCGDTKHWSNKCPKKPSLASAAVDEASISMYTFDLGKDQA